MNHNIVITTRRPRLHSHQPKISIPYCLVVLGIVLISVLSTVFYIFHLKADDHYLKDIRGRQEALTKAIKSAVDNWAPTLEAHERLSQLPIHLEDPKLPNKSEDKGKEIIPHNSDGKQVPITKDSEKHTEKITSVTSLSKIGDKDRISVKQISPKSFNISAFDEIHFVHIPKCGGTTMTAVLRQLQCQRNPSKNVDCCTNPGFCDWHAFRRCNTIKGCINHFPQRKYIFKPMPSIVVFREPTSRLLSAWFYRGHSPNLDFFQVRPYFKEISEGKRPRVTFEEYIEMPEYQNIQTRMLGADSFPYRNISVTSEVFLKAAETINKFFFVALQEEFEISTAALIREMKGDSKNITILKEREQAGMQQIKRQKDQLVSNSTLMNRLREVNDWDIQLYRKAVSKFCELISKYPDLLEKVRSKGKVAC